MNAKRAAAAVLAIVLIVAALLVRRTILDDDAEGPEDSALDPAEIDTLVCAAELADVCTAVAARHTELVVDVAPASVTMDGLAASGPADAPLWLTFEPWPGMVESLRANAGEDSLFDDTRLLAASRLAVATPTPQRAEALAATCAGTPLWRCIGDPRPELRPSIGDADRQALALASFASAVAGYSGTADFDISASQLEPEFTAWLRGLARSGGSLSGGTPARTMATRPSAVNVAATSDAELAALGATSAGFGVQYPEPGMWLQVVLAAPSGVTAPDDLVADIEAELETAGWDDPAVATTPLRSATTMLALRAIWQETT